MPRTVTVVDDNELLHLRTLIVDLTMKHHWNQGTRGGPRILRHEYDKELRRNRMDKCWEEQGIVPPGTQKQEPEDKLY